MKEAVTADDLGKVIWLRFRILREPWGQPFESSTDGNEEACVNAFIDMDGVAVACGRLQSLDKNSAQVRFMAVDKEHQGRGFGRDILEYLEQRAKDLGFQKICLQARENAVKFYERQGYVVTEKSFLLWGQIQHYLMVKSI